MTLVFYLTSDPLPTHQTVDLNTYKGEVATKLRNTWDLAQAQIKKASDKSRRMIVDLNHLHTQLVTGYLCSCRKPILQACQAILWAIQDCCPAQHWSKGLPSRPTSGGSYPNILQSYKTLPRTTSQHVLAQEVLSKRAPDKGIHTVVK